MLGFVAENIRNNMVSFVTPAELDLLLQAEHEGVTVLDVTEEAERMVFPFPVLSTCLSAPCGAVSGS